MALHTVHRQVDGISLHISLSYDSVRKLTYVAREETGPCAGVTLHETSVPMLVLLLGDDDDIVLLER